MYHLFFIHPSVNGNLGCFPPIIINNTSFHSQKCSGLYDKLCHRELHCWIVSCQRTGCHWIWTCFIYILLASPVHAHSSSGVHSCRGDLGRVKIHPVSNGRQGLQGEQEYHFGGVLFCNFSVVKLGLTPCHHHGLQPTSLPCPSLSSGVLLKIMSLESVTISFSVTAFSSCSQYFPASGSFPVSWLFTSGRWPKY